MQVTETNDWIDKNIMLIDRLDGYQKYIDFISNDRNIEGTIFLFECNIYGERDGPALMLERNPSVKPGQWIKVLRARITLDTDRCKRDDGFCFVDMKPIPRSKRKKYPQPSPLCSTNERGVWLADIDQGDDKHGKYYY